MIPNLSRLVLTTGASELPSKRKRTDGAEDKSQPPSSMNVLDVDWLQKLSDLKNADEGQPEEFRFTVESTTLLGPQTITFRLTPHLLLVEGLDSTKDCVEIFFVYDEGDRLHIDIGSLFFNLDSKSFCDASPRLTENSGAGDIVLRFVDCLAFKMNATISLTDASDFQAGKEPRFTVDTLMSSTMTGSLTVMRGYGYYEARGFFSYGQYYTSEIETVAAKKNFDLEFRNIIWSYPVKEVIQRLTTYMNAIADPVAAKNNPFVSQIFFAEFFARRRSNRLMDEAWKNFVEKQHTTYVKPMTERIAELIAWLEELGEKQPTGCKGEPMRYLDISLRALVKQINNDVRGLDVFRGQRVLSNFKYMVGKILELTTKQEKVSSKLEKRIYLVDGVPKHLVIVPNHTDAASAPQCVLRPIESSFTVNFL